jgi:Fe-S-cluster containining protein
MGKAIMGKKKDAGRITSCATSGCGWRCCEFQQGNFIVLYPGELEKAEADGQSTRHLKVIDDDYHGGKKAVCVARNKATCDDGFKPLDCASYPFFPAPPGRGPVDLMIKGKKCPLQTEHLQGHAADVRAAWNAVAARSPETTAWLNKVELVGYTDPPEPKRLNAKPGVLPQPAA